MLIYANHAELIRQDTALAEQVMQILNTARYGSVSEIMDRESAVI